MKKYIIERNVTESGSALLECYIFGFRNVIWNLWNKWLTQCGVICIFSVLNEIKVVLTDIIKYVEFIPHQILVVPSCLRIHEWQHLTSNWHSWLLVLVESILHMMYLSAFVHYFLTLWDEIWDHWFYHKNSYWILNFPSKIWKYTKSCNDLCNGWIQKSPFDQP